MCTNTKRLFVEGLIHDLSLCPQINYADMLKRIDPLRNELKDLETQAQENQQKAEEVNKTIAGLEKSIARYKEEYALLISQAQAIKTDLSNVEAKVGLFLYTHKNIKRKIKPSKVPYRECIEIVATIIVFSLFGIFGGKKILKACKGIISYPKKIRKKNKVVIYLYEFVMCSKKEKKLL